VLVGKAVRKPHASSAFRCRVARPVGLCRALRRGLYEVYPPSTSHVSRHTHVDRVLWLNPYNFSYRREVQQTQHDIPETNSEGSRRICLRVCRMCGYMSSCDEYVCVIIDNCRVEWATWYTPTHASLSTRVGHRLSHSSYPGVRVRVSRRWLHLLGMRPAPPAQGARPSCCPCRPKEGLS